jgi:site-specific DNA-methyltransferase (adenine-specific)
MTVRNRITWHETFGVYCQKKFGRCSRPIYYAVKNQKRFTFNAEAVTIPSARQAKYGDKRANPAGKIMGDVWQVNRVCGTFRERVAGVPTQLPEELVERIIGVSSNPGDTILDPFAGSGTTLAVAARMGRSGIGCELNPEYAKIAEARIARAVA